MTGKILKLIVLLLPWPLRRCCLIRFWGYEIAPDAKIGLSWIFPEKLKMGPGSRIGHLTMCQHIELLELGEKATVGNGNWITGFPRGPWKPFSHQKDRSPALVLGEHAAITSRHLLDCTNRVRIGRYSTMAGFRSQILTHSIDLSLPRQDSAPVEIGEYSFIGTDCVILGGAKLPPRSVLGAKSLLNRVHETEFTLYGGVPAKALKELDRDAGYFSRREGSVT